MKRTFSFAAILSTLTLAAAPRTAGRGTAFAGVGVRGAGF